MAEVTSYLYMEANPMYYIFRLISAIWSVFRPLVSLVPVCLRTWFSEERGEGTITPGSNGASGTVRPV